jgi:AcrR family transcriptional regulator
VLAYDAEMTPDSAATPPNHSQASAEDAGLSPRAREIVAAARELLEQEGEISMRRLADQLGIKAPSLYKHLPGKPALEAAIISDAFLEAAERFEAAATLEDLGAAYRAFALEHPHVYRLMFNGPLPRERLVPGAEARAAAPVIAAVGGDPDRARALYAFAHGMVILELDGRFPEGADLDAAWARGLGAFEGVRPFQGG